MNEWGENATRLLNMVKLSKRGVTRDEVVTLYFVSGRYGYFIGPAYWLQQLDHFVRDGLLVKLLIKGRNHYFDPKHFAALQAMGADLRSSDERQMAADLLIDEGNEAAARLLQAAKRFTARC